MNLRNLIQLKLKEQNKLSYNNKVMCWLKLEYFHFMDISFIKPQPQPLFP